MRHCHPGVEGIYNGMISYEEAYRTVIGRARVLPTEPVALESACGRVLAQDVRIDMDVPPFNKSAMDGYACRKEDLPGPLRVVDVIQAGALPTCTISPGECAKIMTGAKVPEGADWVVMVEECEVDATGAVCVTGRARSANICFHGEDLRAGDVVLTRGVRLEPRHIALLATAGCSVPEVSYRAKAGIIATGNELVEPEEKPGPCQIRNSNSWQIRAQLQEVGAEVRYYGIVGDVETDLEQALKHAMEDNDVILFSGGVSMGDFDFVPAVMKRNGVEILFDSIAMRPGKPTTFGVGPGCYCFGLPGNPVSTYLQCEILVKPFLLALMGHRFRVPWLEFPLEERYQRRKADREAWIPVSLTGHGTVSPASYHGSAHIASLRDVLGFAVIPARVTALEKGAPVKVWTL